MSNLGDKRFDHIRRTYPVLMRPDEVKELLRISQNTLNRLRREGHLTPVGLPTINRIYYLSEDVIALLQPESFPSKAWEESNLKASSRPFSASNPGYRKKRSKGTKDDNEQP